MAIGTMAVVDPPKEFVPIPETAAPLRLTGWDHIAFSVPNLEEAERWYVDVLGAEVIGRRNWGGSVDPMRPHVDIRIGNQVVSLFLGEANGSANTPHMFHYAFNCRNLDELEQWQGHLRSRGVDLRANGVFHGHPGMGAVSVYFEDPWGTRLEITTWLPDWATAEAEVRGRGGVIMGEDAPPRPAH